MIICTVDPPPTNTHQHATPSTQMFKEEYFNSQSESHAAADSVSISEADSPPLRLNLHVAQHRNNNKGHPNKKQPILFFRTVLESRIQPRLGLIDSKCKTNLNGEADIRKISDPMLTRVRGSGELEVKN